MNRLVRQPRTTRAAALLAGIGALSAAFVVAPAVSIPATAPSTAPAAKPTPVRPAVRTVPVRSHPVRTVTAAGPRTAIPKRAFGNAPTTGPTSVGADDDAVVEIPAAGDLVGVTWPAGTKAAADATVLVRVRTAAGWQDWHKVSVDATAGDGAARLGTEPVWTPGAQSVQVRVAKRDEALLSGATLATVTSPPADADAALTPTPVPGAANAAYQPTVISRAQWGADESLRQCSAEYSPTTRAVVVHHTADQNNYSASDSARMIRSIYAYDTKTLGWCDFAYNVIVDKYGKMFEGRAGGLNLPVKGAHAYAFNNDTFGVSILGNYDLVPVPWAGFNALASVIAMRLDSYYLDAYSKVRLTSTASGGTTRYPAGTPVTLNRINGHRDTSYTACPGQYLYPRLGELRDLASSKLSYTKSPIYKKFQSLGGSAKLGSVNFGEKGVWSGTKATKFTGGRRIYAGPTGAFVIGPGTEYEWLRYGGGPKLGNLATDETSTGLGTFTRLDNGRYITWARSGTGVYLVNGGILGYWNRTGGAWTSPYGMAVESITGNSRAWWQRFANGRIYFTKAGAAYGTLGQVDTAYFTAGGPNGPLGLPTGDAQRSAGVTTQRFEGGVITVTTAGKVTVRR